MRIEGAWALAFWLAASGPAGAAVLAQGGPLRLGLDQPGAVPQFSLAFHLSASARVWAEARGLNGLQPGHSGEAPEAFLDDQYLGPLLAEHGGAWRSPEALELAAGDHALLLRCSSVGSPADCGLRALEVVSDGPKAAASAAPAPAPDCGHPTLTRRWPARLHGQSLVLSVLSGRTQSAGVMVQLRSGQAWACRLRLPAPNGQALPLMAKFSVTRAGRGCLLLSLDRQFQGRVDALGYTPDTWEPLTVSLCGGRLNVALAEAPPFAVDAAGPSLELELAAQDVELGLKPALP
jgi:hypothetical protein